jgi:small conductance mechanosensitive channel
MNKRTSGRILLHVTAAAFVLLALAIGVPSAHCWPLPGTLPSPGGTVSDTLPESDAGLSDDDESTIVRGQDAGSEPERIARLQRTVKSDEARLEELTCLLDDPNSDFAKAEAVFNDLDAKLAEKKKSVQQAQSDGNTALAEQLQTELAAVEKSWSLAKKDFQLAIDQRKAQQASIVTLQTKIEKDRQALARLRGTAPPTPQLPPDPALAPQPVAVHAQVVTPPTEPAPATTTLSPLGPIPGAPPSNPAATGNETPPANGANGASASTSGNGTPANGKKPDQQVVAAEQAAAKSEEVARKAEEKAESISERLEILREDISLERKLRDLSNSKIVVARDQLNELNAELERKVAAKEDVVPVRRKIREAENTLFVAQDESQRISEHLDELQSELSRLQSVQVAALEEAESRSKEAEDARQAVAALNNPFALRNVLGWLIDHGLKILLILGVTCIALWLGHLLERRLIALIAMRGSRGNREERENRAKTLVSVLHNALRTVAIGAAIVMVLDECSVPVGPILGGAAVFGLAVAFGAQSLIKDYFTGFMVLMEQQYMIGDVVKIGDVTGQVERISLRMTVLRDLEGRVHFIPHGQIATVTNLTHEWSRAVFNIGVAYKEDVDQVIEVLLGLARAMRKDPGFSYMILEDPTMLGVDELGDSAVVVKFMIKTRPIKQWEVKRELLRRIKNRFDELGIEIPFPHRTLYVANPPASWARENGHAELHH